MTAFSDMFASILSNQQMTEELTYQPKVGAALTLRMAMREPTRAVGLINSSTSAPALAGFVLTSALGTEPKRGDHITRADGKTYEVRAAERGGDGSVWRLSLGLAS
jgi:hypothetical protein